MTRVIVLSCILACLALGGGCARVGLVLVEQSTSTARGIVVGDARSTEDRGPRPDDFRTVPPRTFEVAVGYASLDPGSPAEGLGYAMQVGVRTLVAPVGLAGDGAVAAGDGDVATPFLAGIPPRQMPAARYRIQGGWTGRSMEKIVREITNRHGEFLFMVGVVEFETVESTMMVRPLAEGRGAPASTQAGGVLADTTVFVAGFVARSAGDLDAARRKVLWVEPGRESLVDEPMFFLFGDLAGGRGVSAGDPASAAEHVRRVGRLNARSIATGGELLVYVIDEVDAR